MRITFLGTGTSVGIPMVACQCEVCRSENPKDQRLRCSILVEVADKVMVVDIGPDFRQQMLSAAVKQLDAILITHEHRDHVAGLDDVRPFNFMQSKPMDIYAEEKVIQDLKQSFNYIFGNSDYPGVPQINLRKIQNRPFKVGGIPVIPIRVKHGKMPVLGFRFGDFTYITDANHIDKKEKKKIEGSRYLVLNALRHTPHHSHFTVDEAIAIAKEVGAETTYLTHISHWLGKYDIVEPSLPEGVHLAYDGLVIQIK